MVRYGDETCSGLSRYGACRCLLFTTRLAFASGSTARIRATPALDPHVGWLGTNAANAGVPQGMNAS